MESRLKVRLIVMLVALAGAAGAAHAQTAPYSFTKIMFPAAVSTEPSGINNSGQIVGTYKDAAGVHHGFLFDGSNYVDLGFPGASYNWVFGISRSGQIVGSFSHNPFGPFHAFVSDNGDHVQFDFPGGETDARAMNSLGQIVGIYNTGIGTTDYGFIKEGDSYTQLLFPGATFTYVYGINDAGIVTGTYRDALLRLRGYTYINGVYTQVQFPGASETYLGGINNLNTAVGWNVQGGILNGYVWSQGKSFRALSVTLPGAANTKPRALNDVGEIVGTYTSPECQGVCGFVARPNPGATHPCTQSVALTYTDGLLAMDLTMGTSVPTTSVAWLFVGSAVYRLWSVPLPVLSPAVSVNIPITQLPPSGNIFSLTQLNDTFGRTLCADYAMVNTGPNSVP